MLSVLIYEPDDIRREAVARALMRVPGAVAALKIVLNTGSVSSFSRMLAEIGGAALIVLGMSLRPVNNRARCLEFGSALARNNRDCYSVYNSHELDDLPSLLPQCSRPAGILLGEFTQEQASACFKRIIEDYAALTGEGSDSGAMVVESGTSVYRVPYDQVLYIEALNKKLNICTARQIISVRQTMGAIQDGLPEDFIRCHRSYIVNLRHVDATDYKQMCLTMDDGTRLPIARSMKDALHEQFTRKKGDEA